MTVSGAPNPFEFSEADIGRGTRVREDYDKLFFDILDYTAEKVRVLYRSPEDLASHWQDPATREALIAQLADRGIDLAQLVEQSQQPDADVLDLLCHVAFNAPLLTRRERADKLHRNRPDFFDQYAPEARQIPGDLLDRYTEYGTDQLRLPDALHIPPISDHGNAMEIAAKFGGAELLREAVTRLQAGLYEQKGLL
jgi:type I restriction enzyme R subunit